MEDVNMSLVTVLTCFGGLAALISLIWVLRGLSPLMHRVDYERDIPDNDETRNVARRVAFKGLVLGVSGGTFLSPYLQLPAGYSQFDAILHILLVIVLLGLGAAIFLYLYTWFYVLGRRMTYKGFPRR